jgi:hypothetical protein
MVPNVAGRPNEMGVQFTVIHRGAVDWGCGDDGGDAAEGKIVEWNRTCLAKYRQPVVGSKHL